jgi:DnaJ-class molecular chaperone
VSSAHSRRQTSSRNDRVDDSADYYQILGVPYSATKADITRAYRDAMKRAHPDRRQPADRATAEEHAKLLNRAFTTLSRAESRRAYDATIKAQTVQDQIMSHYVGGFGMPGSADPYGRRLRREPTSAERRDQQRDDRNAMVSVVIVFAAVTLAAVALLLVWAAVSALISALF